MNWTEQSPWIISGWIVTLAVSYLAGLNTHRLTANREAQGRRREARNRIRKLADDAGRSAVPYLWQTQSKISPIIREIQIDIADDLSWYAKRRFNKRCFGLFSQAKLLLHLRRKRT